MGHIVGVVIVLMVVLAWVYAYLRWRRDEQQKS